LYWLYYIILLLISLGSLALVFVALPGLWVMTASAAIYALATHERFVGGRTLWALFLISLAAEILELSAGSAAAKKAGGGRRSAIGAFIGAIVGGIVGSFVLPLVLTIVGICVGAFVGAAATELAGGGEALHSLRVGMGAATGRFLGVVVKLGIGVVMFLLILITAFP
jgi:uncharacterized protein YqgC (DUF456 family)